MAAQRGVYTVNFFEQSITNANGDYDLFEIVPASGKPVELVAIDISNKSEVGDSQEEMVSWRVTRITATFSTGNGTATTPVKLDDNDPAASFTAETVASTPATGTAEYVHTGTFNIRTGLQYIWPPDMRPKGTSGAPLVIRLPTALADDATFSGTLYVREL